MVEKLKDFFSEYQFLGPRDIYHLASIVRMRRVKKGDLLVGPGDLNYNLFMVIKGLLRNYVVDAHGNDSTLLIVPEKEVTSAYETGFRNNPSSEYIEALENSLLLTIDKREFNELEAKSESLLKFQLRQTERALANAVDRTWFLSVLSPEQRYLSFLKTHPKLEKRLKQKHLASFLGIRPQSLSRIKGRLDKPKKN